MSKQQKTYTTEFKQEAVQQVKRSGKPMSQIARELGVSEGALWRMVQTMGRAGRASLSWQWASERRAGGDPPPQAGTLRDEAGARYCKIKKVVGIYSREVSVSGFYAYSSVP